MNGHRARAVAIIFLVLVLILTVIGGTEAMDANARFQYGFSGALRLVGGLLAAVAAVELCFLAIHGTTRAMPGVAIVLLGGLAVYSPDWPVALGLAAVAIAVAFRPALASDPETEAAEEPEAKPARAARKKTTSRSRK